MSLAQRHRSQLHDKLAPIVGEDTIEALLAEFPATDLDRPATEGFVRAEIAGVRTDIAEVRTGMAELRTELKSDIAELRQEMLHLDVTFSERLRQQTMWMSGLLFVGISATATIARLVG